VTVLAGAFWVTCLVLLAAGATKLADPAALAGVLQQLRFPLAVKKRSATLIAQLLGLVEVGLGLAALVVGGAVMAAAVALAYLGFAVLLWAARRASLGTCGCFGSRSGPPSRLHLFLNLGSACVAAAAGVVGAPAVADGLLASPLGNATLVVCVLATTVGILFLETEHG
jgi:hypothetical protein